MNEENAQISKEDREMLGKRIGSGVSAKVSGMR